jgi:hypothetical protein
VQQAEPEVTFHGEFLDTFDNLSIAFELEDARQSSFETVGAKSVHENLDQKEDMGTAAAPNYHHHHEQLVIHQTCASAYTQLLQRRCASLREVCRPTFLFRSPLFCGSVQSDIWNKLVT